MALGKYDPQIAGQRLKAARSEQGDSRNIRILLARGMKHEVAVRVVGEMRNHPHLDPEAYAAGLLTDSRNLDPHYLNWRDDAAFDPAVWAEIAAESEAEIEYTTPIRKRLRQRAIEQEEELRLAEFYEMDEADYFWREQSRYPNTGSVTSPASVQPYPQRRR